MVRLVSAALLHVGRAAVRAARRVDLLPLVLRACVDRGRADPCLSRRLLRRRGVRLRGRGSLRCCRRGRGGARKHVGVRRGVPCRAGCCGRCARLSGCLGGSRSRGRRRLGRGPAGRGLAASCRAENGERSDERLDGQRRSAHHLMLAVPRSSRNAPSWRSAPRQRGQARVSACGAEGTCVAAGRRNGKSSRQPQLPGSEPR